MAHSQRDLRLDLFKGIALIGIAVNHTVPSKAMLAAGGHYQFGHLFEFNFADVFVFLSGLVCGNVYGRVLEQQGFRAVQRKALRRIGTLFTANVATALACLLVVWAFGFGEVVPALHYPKHEHWWSALLGTAFFYNGLPYFDILSLYVLLLALLPGMLWLHARLGYWALLVGAVPYIAVNAPMLQFTIPRFGSFFGHPAAWQFLFFVAVVLGYRIPRNQLPPIDRRLAISCVLLILLGTDFFKQTHIFATWLSAKATCGPMRIIELLGVSYLVSQWLPRDLPAASQGFLAGLARLGQQSLPVFCSTMLYSYIGSYAVEAVHATPYGHGIAVALVAAATYVTGQLTQAISQEPPFFVRTQVTKRVAKS